MLVLNVYIGISLCSCFTWGYFMLLLLARLLFVLGMLLNVISKRLIAHVIFSVSFRFQ